MTNSNLKVGGSTVVVFSGFPIGSKLQHVSITFPSGINVPQGNESFTTTADPFGIRLSFDDPSIVWIAGTYQDIWLVNGVRYSVPFNILP